MADVTGLMRSMMVILAWLVCGMAVAAQGQGPAPAGLAEEIARADARMFEAFNAHALDRMMESFAKELEFYHDKDGLLSYGQVNEGFRRMFAQDNGMKRQLVPGSLEVYPIPNYGAMEVGLHRFCHVEDGREICAVFKFTMVWRQVGERWQVTRALSYDHQ